MRAMRPDAGVMVGCRARLLCGITLAEAYVSGFTGASMRLEGQGKMRTLLACGVASVIGITALPSLASACGGFFCGNQPVDQQAERIVFSVNADGTVTMVVQIQYQGEAADFAWVLPLGDVPDAMSLDTFPQAALNALDANSGPQFQFPDDPECSAGWELDAAAGGPPAPRSADGGVDVHLRQEVGPFDVAVISGTDPAALVSWLRDNGFRVGTPVEPYIAAYTSEGKKFLALRLQPGRDTSDIEPFMFTLPGQNPGIPLRLTAIAAEPEMGIAVFILGDQRFGPAGDWAAVEIDDNEIVWRPYTWPMETNWTSLVARGVDEAGGRGWVTEYAGSTESYLELVRATMPADADQERAKEALLGIMEGKRYMTRLYTRLSPEEMTSDPMFRRVSGGDVDRTRMLARFVEGRDLCAADMERPGMIDSTTPCDFATCGAGGFCSEVEREDGTVVAGCACVPGSTARTTLDPRGRASVSCVDTRLSFLNPGDRSPEGVALPDPCVGVSCGEGSCIAMNMTPTCVCNRGFVAVGTVDPETGARTTECVVGAVTIPPGFYARRLPALPHDLPGGRIADVIDETRPGGGGLCSADGGGSAAAGLGFAMLALGYAFRRRR
jgi:hypothetical protein